MAILKCKICGGDLELNDDRTVGMCQYCGCTMTFPKIDDEQRAAVFNRGNHFRRIGEFDKALAVYERIVREDETDAEAHWCCALCRFGIEYVEDPATFEWLPTCHRASFDSFLEDVDYLAALQHSEGLTRRQYQKDAAKIAEVQRGILATSQNAEPYDVFICYKESDENGRRTVDSTLAQDIYYQLTEQGRKVFFARITLEDVVGTQYEPFIFAALNSAKVMIVVGTKPEYLNAVWVKNEWSRFLAMMKKDRHKLLLPCYRDMDPYDLPEQLSVLQSYDMAKIGFIQDLIRGVSKVLDAEKKPEVVKETVVVNNTAPATNIAPLLERAFIFLEDGDWENADAYCEKVLDADPKNAQAYLGKLMVDLAIRTQGALADCDTPFDDNANFQKAVRYGNGALKDALNNCNKQAQDRNSKKILLAAEAAKQDAERQEVIDRQKAEERAKLSKKVAIIALSIIFLLLILTFCHSCIMTGSNGSDDNRTSDPASTENTIGTTVSNTMSQSSGFATSMSTMTTNVNVSTDNSSTTPNSSTITTNTTNNMSTTAPTTGLTSGTTAATKPSEIYKSNIALEVRKNFMGENKWQGKLISFANGLYVTLNTDTSLTARSGVFHNTSDKTIVLTVAGTYGCSAVLDENGVVIEGRDGVNSKLVNTKNPTRAGSTATTLIINGERMSVSSAFAKQLSIPAGGFAVVIQPQYAGTTAETDGRAFMNYNVIYEIGNVVRLFWVDTNEILTKYINQAPTVTGNDKILIQVGDTEFNLDSAVIAGIIAKDDDGTFTTTDDITLKDIKIIDDCSFDVFKYGVYAIKLSVTDGELTTTFTREVEVQSKGISVFQIGERKMDVQLDFVAKDQELSGIGYNMFIIYTSGFNGNLPANSFGIAFVVNKYGEIVRIYDGANGMYFDGKNPEGIVDYSKCNPQDYLKQAVDSLQSGEIAIIAPNSSANNPDGGSRKFLLVNRTIGAVVSGLGLTFEEGSEFA